MKKLLYNKSAQMFLGGPKYLVHENTLSNYDFYYH